MTYELIYETPSDERGNPIPDTIRAIVLEIDEFGIKTVNNIFEYTGTKRQLHAYINKQYDYKLPRAIDQTKPVAPTPEPPPIPRYGTPGGPRTWAYNANENCDDECIVYADTMEVAINLFGFYHSGEDPRSIRIMADNE